MRDLIIGSSVSTTTYTTGRRAARGPEGDGQRGGGRADLSECFSAELVPPPRPPTCERESQNNCKRESERETDEGEEEEERNHRKTS